LRGPDASEVKGSIKNADAAPRHPSMGLDKVKPEWERRTLKKHFKGYERLVDTAWLFQFKPVLWTSLLLPLVAFAARGPERVWWIVAAALWYFSVVLLCTVGKPLNRYLLPVTPVMFWALSWAVATPWLALLRRLDQPPPSAR
jgi:hypothetical protein